MSEWFRLQLRKNGYDPLPLRGKAPALSEWQKRIEVPEDIIRIWSKHYSYWKNTGILTRLVPTLDLDILDEDAARTAAELVRARYGSVLMRIGRPPKCAIPFRTDEPFSKIIASLTAPDGTVHKIEFLGDGQQVVVDGIHPDTHKPFRWCGGDLTGTPREALPFISEVGARELVDCIVATLQHKHGMIAERARVAKESAPAKKSAPNNASLVGRRANGEVPKPLYNKVCELMPGSRGIHRRRVIELLRPLVEAREGRNDTLFDKATALRKPGGPISDGIITYEAAADLLLLVAQINGYLAKDGENETKGTIRSGLGLHSIRDAQSVEDEMHWLWLDHRGRRFAHQCEEAAMERFYEHQQ